MIMWMVILALMVYPQKIELNVQMLFQILSKIKDEEMVEHKIINDHIQQTTFSNNITVEIDTKENTYRIV